MARYRILSGRLLAALSALCLTAPLVAADAATAADVAKDAQDTPDAGFVCRPAVLGAYVDADTRVYRTATGCPNRTVTNAYVSLESYGYGPAYGTWGSWYRAARNPRDRVDHHRPDSSRGKVHRR